MFFSKFFSKVRPQLFRHVNVIRFAPKINVFRNLSYTTKPVQNKQIVSKFFEPKIYTNSHNNKIELINDKSDSDSDILYCGEYVCEKITEQYKLNYQKLNELLSQSTILSKRELLKMIEIDVVDKYIHNMLRRDITYCQKLEESYNNDLLIRLDLKKN
ncbi:MAG: hypothetical protein Edafosvirus9_5 [Edafosvirus sp.]|uniref:Uncharacterized protein n=1 Tax=Edafosvirus sp. TaxID=2487765 RepID=A0A3G4ZWC8_9VIRU|nr:MAG: hypothetical protein Edafosvirus9_5 [Edafosvirus sp.]